MAEINGLRQEVQNRNKKVNNLNEQIVEFNTEIKQLKSKHKSDLEVQQKMLSSASFSKNVPRINMNCRI